MSIPENYVLGNSVREQERLMLQGRILRPYTERFFRASGIGPGMHVLDLGSGMGDVALLCADLVGPAGRVVGVDRDQATLERARQRTEDQGCASWVSFQAAEFDEFSTTQIFDALVGRYVLLYCANPSNTLRRFLRFLKPGGIVAFHEHDFSYSKPTDPPVPALDVLLQLIPEAFRRSGWPTDFGRRLAPTFVAAGLPYPTIVAEIPIGGGPGSYLPMYQAATIFSLATRFAQLEMRMPEGFTADETLAGRIEALTRQHCVQVHGAVQYGAWTRKSL